MKDSAGNVLTYWPISDLEEGDLSDVLTFKITGPVSGKLVATNDPRARVWARVASVGSYVNISTGFIALSLSSGDHSYECYVEALSPISGLQRVALSVIAAVAGQAGWAE